MLTLNLPELLSTIVFDQCRGHGREVAQDNPVEVVKRQPDPVIGYSVLREVVGADTLRTIARADQRAALFGAVRVRLFLHLLEDPGLQESHRLGLVLVLAPLVAAE